MKAFDMEKILEVIIAFNSKKNYFDLLNVILDKMMEMTNADAGTLYVLEDNKLHFRIIRTISMNVFKGGADDIGLPPISLEGNIENVSAYAAIKNEIVCIDNVYDDERFNFSGPKNYDKATGYSTRSMLVFPLTSAAEGRAEVIGVIQLINSIDPETGAIRSFRDIYEPSILLAMSNISANALANILYIKHLTETLTERARIRSELSVAQRIQSSVLPKVSFCDRTEFDISAVMKPAKDVGGDLYDYFLVDDDTLAVVIGDVAGKGVPASLFMMVTRTLIKSEVKYSSRPDEIFDKVNKQLCDGNDENLFVTSFIAFYSFRTGVLRFTNAGHCFPIILRADGGREYLKGGVSMVLAVMDTVRYSCAESWLLAGDALLLYTDGVTEAFNPNDEQFSDRRLLGLTENIDISAATAKEVVDEIVGAVDSFADTAEQSDDITVLALKRLR